MWSAIGRATARQVRVGGRLSIRTATRLAAQPGPRTAPVIPSGIRVAAVFSRGFAQVGRPRKSATDETTASAGAKTKPAAKKKTTAKKTGTTKTATEKKAAKAKAPAAKKPKARKPKPELTAEEKVKLRVRELRKRALQKEEPKKLPTTQWMVYWNERVKGSSGPIIGRAPEISRDFKALSAAELEKLQDQANQNKVANEVTLRNWVDSHSPLDIRRANRARRELRVKHGRSSKSSIPDPRFPKKAMSPWVAFIKSRFQTHSFTETAMTDKVGKLLAEWRQLSAEERQPFIDIAATDAARFKTEMEALGLQDESEK